MLVQTIAVSAVKIISRNLDPKESFCTRGHMSALIRNRPHAHAWLMIDVNTARNIVSWTNAAAFNGASHISPAYFTIFGQPVLISSFSPPAAYWVIPVLPLGAVPPLVGVFRVLDAPVIL